MFNQIIIIIINTKFIVKNAGIKKHTVREVEKYLGKTEYRNQNMQNMIVLLDNSI